MHKKTTHKANPIMTRLKTIGGKLKTRNKNGFYYDTTDRQINVATIEHMKATHVVVFSTYKLLNYVQTLKLVDEFVRRMNRKINGKKARHEEFRLTWAHNFEIASGNAHMHSGVVLSTCELDIFERHARHIWQDIIKTGTQGKQGTKAQLWLHDYKAGAAYYITKDGVLVATTA
jgi:hypothetical protein